LFIVKDVALNNECIFTPSSKALFYRRMRNTRVYFRQVTTLPLKFKYLMGLLRNTKIPLRTEYALLPVNKLTSYFTMCHINVPVLNLLWKDRLT